jgi:hypothetical protein
MLDITRELTQEPWPPNYVAQFSKRVKFIKKLRSNPAYQLGADTFYKTHPHEFIEHWCVTVDPRNAGDPDKLSVMPFILFRRQREFVDFLLACWKGQADGLVEKSRDMGATWICVCFAVWLWKYHPGSSVGFGSRKKELVDRLGDMDSIFEKIRSVIRYMPKEMRPKGYDPRIHENFMKVLNPENGSSITGEIGDNIGRGGRKSIYFKDESAHYEHPELIEAALGDNTNVQIDISSVNGIGNVFHRKRDNGVEWVADAEVRKDKTNVFIMDWRDHPAKDQAWYDRRRKKAEEDGLLHLFAQEVDRDYASSVEGVIIPKDWVSSAIDAHLKLAYLGDWNTGLYGAGLDVADEGLDRNALAVRRGPVLTDIREWGERDTGVTTRRTVDYLKDHLPLELQYDCIGVGSGVKAEANRLQDESLLPEGLLFVPWNAAAAVLHPNDRVVPPRDEDDEEEKKSSIRNKDFYANLKAQGWWELRRRFEKTHKAVTEGEQFDVDELISLPSELPLIRSLQNELSQATAGPGAKLKMTVNKKPDGSKSPNLGDAVMMAFWPIPQLKRGEAAFGVYGI